MIYVRFRCRRCEKVYLEEDDSPSDWPSTLKDALKKNINRLNVHQCDKKHPKLYGVADVIGADEIK